MTLSQIRQQHGMSMGELARRIGTSTANVSRWERGLVEPRYRHAVRLAEVLGVKVEQVYAAK